MSLRENNHNLITILTNQAFPTDTEQPIEVEQLGTYPSWRHDTITYHSIWADGQRLPLALRSYRSRVTLWQIEDPYKLDRVWAVLRRLRLDNYPGLRPLARGAFGQTGYIIWQQAPGQNIYDLKTDIRQQAATLIPQQAQLLARLHALNHNGLNNEPLYQATVAGTLVRILLWSRQMNNKALHQTIGRLKPAVASVQSWPHRLIHGDPHLGNLLIEEDQITALRNWENAAIGDPRWDIMAAAYWLRKYNPEQADHLVNWYENFTSSTITNRPFWYALISVRLWALKAWVDYAIDNEIVPSEGKAWTEDLAEVKTQALQDLDQAGL